jgi:hypothetical protein
MLRFDVNRREFVKIVAGTGAALAMPNFGLGAVSSKMIGIQVGAISFVDEGTERVLDVLLLPEWAVSFRRSSLECRSWVTQ